MATEALGVLFGVLGCIFIVGLLVSLIACVRVHRRPTSNGRALSSFAVVACAPVIAGFIGVATRTPGEPPAGNCLTGVLMVAGVIGGMVWAVKGLLEMKKEPGRWKEGKGWAIAALCMGGCYILIWIGAFATGAATAMARSESRVPIKADFPELGFRLEPPPGPWRALEKGGNPKACLTLMRRGPEMYFMVIGEKTPEGSSIALPALAAIVKANLLSGAPGANVTSEEPEFIQGMEGMRMLAEVPQGADTLLFRYWLHATPQHVYQLIAWSGKGERAALMKETDGILRGFRVLP